MSSKNDILSNQIAVPEIIVEDDKEIECTYYTFLDKGLLVEIPETTMEPNRTIIRAEL